MFAMTVIEEKVSTIFSKRIKQGSSMQDAKKVPAFKMLKVSSIQYAKRFQHSRCLKVPVFKMLKSSSIQDAKRFKYSRC